MSLANKEITGNGSNSAATLLKKAATLSLFGSFELQYNIVLLVEQKNPAKLVTINGKRGIDLLLLKLIRLQSILLYSCLPMGKISLNPTEKGV